VPLDSLVPSPSEDEPAAVEPSLPKLEPVASLAVSSSDAPPVVVLPDALPVSSCEPPTVPVPGGTVVVMPVDEPVAPPVSLPVLVVPSSPQEATARIPAAHTAVPIHNARIG
jgi:hypothetical protein